MNVYVVMSWSKKAGAKCEGLNTSEGSACNLAEHAVEDYIIASGCGGLPANNADSTEFWAEEDPDGFRVRIETKKIFMNFANAF
jgi:hypothetical protein